MILQGTPGDGKQFVITDISSEKPFEGSRHPVSASWFISTSADPHKPPDPFELEWAQPSAQENGNPGEPACGEPWEVNCLQRMSCPLTAVCKQDEPGPHLPYFTEDFKRRAYGGSSVWPAALASTPVKGIIPLSTLCFLLSLGHQVLLYSS